MTPLTIYLWQQADSLDTLFELLALPCLLAGLFGTAFTCVGIILESCKEDIEKLRRMRKLSLISLAIGLFLGLAAVATPSSKTIAMMVAIPAIANSEPIQKDLPELYQLAKDALKEQITGKSTK